MTLGDLYFGGKGFKALIVAKASNVDLHRIDVNNGGSDPNVTSLNPFCKVPILKTPHGPIFESNAIARYVAETANNAQLYPSSDITKSAQIDGWMELTSRFQQDLSKLYSIAMAGAGKMEEVKMLKDRILSGLDPLEKQLLASSSSSSSSFVVGGSAPSLADICLVVDLHTLFSKCLTPEERKRIPCVEEWFVATTSLSDVSSVIGPVELCETFELKIQGGGNKPKKGDKPNKNNKNGGESKSDGGKNTKKNTVKKGEGKIERNALGLTAYSKEGDFGEWYSRIVTEAEMVSYYPVSGCYILRPWAYSQWQVLQEWFDAEIKKLGVENCYFPLFVTPDVLEKEKAHVEGFAAEVAWVTKSGTSDLEVPLAIRPTSETVMYPYFSDWIRSHRDLPLRLNQWTNVVRWEFKQPTPFIRSREFLWQEGHTAFATKAEADAEVRQILDLYRRVYEELLAVPTCPGVKSENEKFAGGLYTTTVEAFVPATGKGIQGATSHCLGQNFANMFDINFLAEDGEKHKVWQNSWGFTTRTLGVMIMVHGDNKGLVLPPRVAPKQLVIIPIPKPGGSTPEEAKAQLDQVYTFEAELKKAGVRVTSDTRENQTPGFKYNHWEVKGVPIRLELGPRDMEKKTVVLARRDTSTKEFVTWDKVVTRTVELLEEIQKDMFQKAKAEFDECFEQVEDWESFMASLDRKHMCLAPWNESVEVEEEIRKRSTTSDAMGAKSLCIPFQQPEMKPGTKCFISGQPAKSYGLFGRSY